LDGGSLSVFADASPAIGSAPYSECNSLAFENGTLIASASSATAIGSGSNSTLNHLLFKSGIYTVSTISRGFRPIGDL
jgi:hypothetical protein